MYIAHTALYKSPTPHLHLPYVYIVRTSLSRRLPPPPPSVHNSNLLRFAGAAQLREASSSVLQEGCLPPVAGIIGAISRWANLGDYTIRGDHGALVRFVADGGDCCYESAFHRGECSPVDVRRYCISAYVSHFEQVGYDVSCEMRRHVSIRSGKAGQGDEEWKLKNGWVCEAGTPVEAASATRRHEFSSACGALAAGMAMAVTSLSSFSRGPLASRFLCALWLKTAASLAAWK